MEQAIVEQLGLKFLISTFVREKNNGFYYVKKLTGIIYVFILWIVHNDT